MTNIYKAQVAALMGKSRNRSFGSAKANRSGHNLESAIIAGAAASGVVRLTKLPGCGARFIAANRIIRQDMPCDFIGVVIGSGRGIFFDAKSVYEKQASIRVHDPAIVKAHQAAFLMSMRDAGAIAGLLIESKRMMGYLWLDAKYLNEGTAIGWDDPRFVDLGSAAMRPDFTRLVGGTR